MKFFIGDLLACPVCKSRDLLIHPIEVGEEEAGVEPERVKCRTYCHYLRRPASQVPIDVCRVCVRKRIVHGVIVCRSCGRWYPIVDTIAVMLGDDYRDKRVDRDFLRRFWERLPEEVRALMKNPRPGDLLAERDGER